MFCILQHVRIWCCYKYIILLTTWKIKDKEAELEPQGGYSKELLFRSQELELGALFPGWRQNWGMSAPFEPIFKHQGKSGVRLKHSKCSEFPKHNLSQKAPAQRLLMVVIIVPCYVNIFIYSIFRKIDRIFSHRMIIKLSGTNTRMS